MAGVPNQGASRTSTKGIGPRVQSYQNMCNILTESVAKAREDLAHLAPGAAAHSASSSPVRSQGGASHKRADQAVSKADDRIAKQKRQFANLLK